MRALLFALAALTLAWLGDARAAWAFGDEGAFNPRILLTGTARWEGARASAPSRWSAELVGRTSAPARTTPTTVHADDPRLLAEPFVIWGGGEDVPPLTPRELRGMRAFVELGGVLLVDDFAPETGAFTRAAKRELQRVLPDGAVLPIAPQNVLFRSFYMMRRAAGRVTGDGKLEGIQRGGLTQVIFSSHDLLGALARGAGGVASLGLSGGESEREQAVRLAVNIAMYVLCSTYKDDQVHAPFLMRRRASEGP